MFLNWLINFTFKIIFLIFTCESNARDRDRQRGRRTDAQTNRQRVFSEIWFCICCQSLGVSHIFCKVRQILFCQKMSICLSSETFWCENRQNKLSQTFTQFICRYGVCYFVWRKKVLELLHNDTKQTKKLSFSS